MRVFLSQSGPLSLAVGKILHEWIPSIIQSAEPFISSEIPKGAGWFEQISDKLKSCGFGIVCVTKSNLDSRWLNFEAGALSIGIGPEGKRRVAPLIIDFPTDNLSGPLAQFQYSSADKDGLLKIFLAMNTAQENPLIAESVLQKQFDRCWRDMEMQIQEAQEKYRESDIDVPERTDSEILSGVEGSLKILIQKVDQGFAKGKIKSAQANLRGTSLLTGISNNLDRDMKKLMASLYNGPKRFDEIRGLFPNAGIPMLRRWLDYLCGRGFASWNPADDTVRLVYHQIPSKLLTELAWIGAGILASSFTPPEADPSDARMKPDSEA